MQLIEIVFDSEHYSNLANLGDISWYGALDHYLSSGITKCLSPNKLDPQYTAYYHKVDNSPGNCYGNPLWVEPLSAEHSDSKIKEYFAIKPSQDKYQLFKKDITFIADESPSNLEELAISLKDSIVTSGVNHLFGDAVTLLNNITSYTTSDKIIDGIINELEKNHLSKTFLKKDYAKSETALLTKYVLSHEADSTQLAFWEKLLKNHELNEIIKRSAFETLNKVTSDPSWVFNEAMLTRFIALLEYDDASNNLAKGLLTAAEIHGFKAATEEDILKFQKYVYDQHLRYKATNFISHSLVGLLKQSHPNLEFIEKQVAVLFENTSHLTSELTEAIFDSYGKQQSYFGEVVLNIIAEDKLLSKNSLNKLVSSVTASGDIKRSLFIALRLSQHNVALPAEVIEQLSMSLTSINTAERVLALDLFTNIGITKKVESLLLSNIEKVSKYEAIKIRQILKLSESQEIKPNSNENPWSALKIDASIPTYVFDALANLNTNLNWESKLLLDVLANTKNPESVVSLLEKMSDYSVYPEMVDRYGNTAESILEKCTSDQSSLFQINRLIADNHFFIGKTVESLLMEFREMNLGKPKIIDLLDVGYYEKQFSDLKEARERLHLDLWEKQDFLNWRENYKEFDLDNCGELLAVLTYAMFKTVGKEDWYPRPIQLISLLTLLKHPTGGLAQISTGEGKSNILAMFAAIKVMMGHTVDIVTSSKDLAEEGAKEHKGFFDLLGISSGHNIGGNNKGIKECYKYDIVYGDALNFIGDDLKDNIRNVKSCRTHDIVIIDEVDNVLIDQLAMKVQLSSRASGSEYLASALAYMWNAGVERASHLSPSPEGCYVDSDLFSATTIGSNNTKVVVGDSCMDYVMKFVSNFTSDVIFEFDKPSSNRTLTFPGHLYQVAKDQMPSWLNSFKLSFDLLDKQDYVVLDNGSLSPINKQTGDIQNGLQWSDGLHPMLQLKHKLALSSENFINTFMSYNGFFKQYIGAIYGVTGTLGKVEHQDFLNEQFATTSFAVPTFIHKDTVEFPTVLVDTAEKWEDSLFGAIQRKILNKRAALIVMNTVAEVEYCRDMLVGRGYNPEQIYTYGLGAKDEAEVIKRELKQGDIIVATNLAGRGVDIKLNPDVKKQGGLHGIQTSLASSSRIEEQSKGRSARNGEPGSSQLILLTNDLDCDINCLKAHRDYQDAKNLLQDQICNLPIVALEDKLYRKYQAVNKKVNSPTGFRLTLESSKDCNEDYPSICLSIDRNNRLFFNFKGVTSSVGAIDATDAIQAIDNTAYKHIINLLSKPDAEVTNLNGQDFEIIHFIAACNGYSNYPKFLSRVEHEFNQLVRSYSNSYLENNTEKYLRNLLISEQDYSDLLKQSNRTDTVDPKILEKVKQRKKYELWFKDRELYNNEFEIAQIQEDFGYWLKRQEPEFKKLETCSSANANTAKQLIENVTETISANFELFENEIYAQQTEDSLIKNPSHYVLKAWRYLQIHTTGSSGYTASSSVSSYLWQSISWAFSSLSKLVDFNNYDLKNPLGDAQKFLEKAIDLDESYAWPAHNALAYVHLVKDGHKITEKQEAVILKNKVVRQLDLSASNIHNVNIPAYQAILSNIILTGVANYTDDVAVKLIGQIQVLEKIKETLVDNANYVRSLPSDYIVNVERAIELDEVFQKVNITQAVSNYLNTTDSVNSIGQHKLHEVLKGIKFIGLDQMEADITNSGGILFKLNSRQLYEEPKSWLGTIFIAALGIISIAAGVGMIAYGIGGTMFSSSLGLSLISMGVGDIISSAASVIQGQPMDIGSYLNSKGMAIGVAIATAGTLTFLEQIAQVAEIHFAIDAAQRVKDFAATAVMNPTSFIANTLLTQGVTTGIGAVLTNLGKRAIDTKDIYQDAKNMINEIITSLESYLNLIYTTDSINQNQELSNALNKAIEEAINKQREKFHDDTTQFATGYTGNLVGHALGDYSFIMAGLSSVINSGTKVAMGIYKNSEAMGEIKKSTTSAIRDIATNFAYSSDAIFKLQLYANFKTEAEYLFATMGGSYKSCGQVDAIAVKADFKGLDVKFVCQQVASMLSNNNFDGLRAYFTENVASLIKHIQKNEIARPAMEAVAAEGGNVIAAHISKKLQEMATEQDVVTETSHRENIDPEKIKKVMKQKTKPKDEEFDDFAEDEVLEEMFHEASKPVPTLVKTSNKIYPEPIGPQEPFADDFNNVKAKIDNMDLSETEKINLKTNAYNAIKVIHAMSNQQRAQLAEEIKETYREKSLWESMHFVNPANAVVPIVIAAGVAITPELLVAFTALAAVTGVALKNAIDGSQAYLGVDLGKPSVHSTPIHKPEDNTLKTPISDYETEDEIFWDDDYNSDLPGFTEHKYRHSDEGFVAEDVDTSILMKDWEVKEFDKVMLSDKFGKMYRDPKATSENGRRIWWSKDTAGHGGSAWKVFEETSEGLNWYKDADKNGDFMHDKHKGPVGKTIEWKDLRGTTVNGK